MNLKEAFRYQNKLQSFLDDAQSILNRDSNVTRVENTYLRHKVMAEAEDEDFCRACVDEVVSVIRARGHEVV